jgi:hypothetical protein
VRIDFGNGCVWKEVGKHRLLDLAMGMDQKSEGLGSRCGRILANDGGNQIWCPAEA